MERKVQRHYAITDREIREAVLAWLKARDFPYPKPSAADVKWEKAVGGLTIEWIEQDEI